ncbi:hypothetical protein FA10DRAFT_294976 [Acaromyces ingoldii]|uniref:Uncharacterized protein n=1 Tax=Acaromyces ingoldii TaxID=215250 RepID=A0A316YI92_9BASI|nr:hypothetical protein FA10DRAFT_294976 [Acaromyces ingoldii]PWN89147.1 hypothetical protein FA10DRAFT_294976 [Acaromyces ingoldii]
MATARTKFLSMRAIVLLLLFALISASATLAAGNGNEDKSGVERSSSSSPHTVGTHPEKMFETSKALNKDTLHTPQAFSGEVRIGQQSRVASSSDDASRKQEQEHHLKRLGRGGWEKDRASIAMALQQRVQGELERQKQDEEKQAKIHGEGQEILKKSMEESLSSSLATSTGLSHSSLTQEDNWGSFTSSTQEGSESENEFLLEKDDSHSRRGKKKKGLLGKIGKSKFFGGGGSGSRS